jgi:hypothetical protein
VAEILLLLGPSPNHTQRLSPPERGARYQPHVSSRCDVGICGRRGQKGRGQLQRRFGCGNGGGTRTSGRQTYSREGGGFT